MLPRIHTHERPELPDHRILICVRLDADRPRLRILHQPRPTAALDARERGVELLFHGVEAAVVGVDRFGECAGRGLAAAGGFGREVLPEEGVVDVAAYQSFKHQLRNRRVSSPSSVVFRNGFLTFCHTSMKVDQRLNGNLRRNIALALRLLQLLHLRVQAVDVRRMVLVVVQLHDLAADRGLERAIVVW